MVSEQRSKRPFAVYCIVLLELYLVASTGYCVWRARSVFRTDVDPVAACQDALPLLTPPDGLSLCATFGLDQAKSDVLFNGFAMLGFDIFFLVTAVGLWRLQKWARSCLVTTCVTQLAFLARWLVIAKAVGIPDLFDQAARYEVPEIAILLVVLVALHSTSVPKAFGATA